MAGSEDCGCVKEKDATNLTINETGVRHRARIAQRPNRSKMGHYSGRKGTETFGFSDGGADR